jgi:hypothetical protein
MRHTSAVDGMALDKVAYSAGVLLSVSNLFAGYQAGQVADIESFFKYRVSLTISG